MKPVNFYKNKIKNKKTTSREVVFGQTLSNLKAESASDNQWQLRKPIAKRIKVFCLLAVIRSIDAYDGSLAREL